MHTTSDVDARGAGSVANGATAALQRLLARLDAGDLDGVRALCAQGFHWEDRRLGIGLEGDVERMIASAREHGRACARTSPLGVASERVGIQRVVWGGGPAEHGGCLAVAEIDAGGLLRALICLDPDDPRAAQGEAWKRWVAIDATAAGFTSALGGVLDAANDRDLARYRALFADDVVIEDHRFPDVRFEGGDAYAEKVALLWQAAPDSRIDAGWIWPAHAAHGAVTVTRRSGSFADEFLWLYTVGAGRITRVEVFALDQVDAARARHAELATLLR